MTKKDRKLQAAEAVRELQEYIDDHMDDRDEAGWPVLSRRKPTPKDPWPHKPPGRART